MPCFDQGPEVPLQGVTAGPGNLNRVGNAHAASVTGDFQYSSREFREVAEQEPLAVDDRFVLHGITTDL